MAEMEDFGLGNAKGRGPDGGFGGSGVGLERIGVGYWGVVGLGLGKNIANRIFFNLKTDREKPTRSASRS